MLKKVIRICLILAAFILGEAALFAQKPLANPQSATIRKSDEKALPEKYRDFLNLVAYIITAKEKDVFLQLTNDRDRDVFIESFWKLRDPTPGTPENETRTEHVRRFNHANKNLGRGTGRPGWMTDRGRFYIILGEPDSIDRYYGTLGVYPCEVWYFHTDEQRGLPPHFGLIFYQKSGAGEFRLYDPIVDGPKSLMMATPSVVAIGADDYEEQYEKLRELAPALADISISLIPGELGYGYKPSPRNTILMASILEFPKSGLKPSYATHFLDYKGMVSTEYMSNFIDSETTVAVIYDALIKANFIHFSVKPANVSVDYYEPEDKFYCAFTVSVSLRIPEKDPEETVFQYTKDLPFYFSPAETDRIRANGITIEDVFPVIEGNYRLIILLQNAVAKEFSVFETDVSIPRPSPKPRLAGLHFGYKFQDYPAQINLPFKILDKKLVVDPKNTYARTDTIAYVLIVAGADEHIWKLGSVKTSFRGASGKSESGKSYEQKLRDYPFGSLIPIQQSLQAGDFPPDYYEVEALLQDGDGKTVEACRGSFIVVAADSIGHPIARAKGFPLENKFLYSGMLASQYARIGDFQNADAFYKKAFEQKPDYTKGWADYAAFLLKAGFYERALEAAEKFKEDGAMRFEYFTTRGRALMGVGLLSEAVNEWLEANKIYNSDIEVLNSLGFCYFKVGKKKEALDTLRASLRLNSAQDDIKKLIAEIEKTLK